MGETLGNNPDAPSLEGLVEEARRRFFTTTTQPDGKPYGIHAASRELVLEALQTHEPLDLAVILLRQTSLVPDDLDTEVYLWGKDWNVVFINLSAKIIERELANKVPNIQLEDYRRFLPPQRSTGSNG